MSGHRVTASKSCHPPCRPSAAALSPYSIEVFTRAEALRREKAARPTKTIIDILVRETTAVTGAVALLTEDTSRPGTWGSARRDQDQ